MVVPPDFVAEETSGDVMVPEGGTVKLTCRASGFPDPSVQWRREDGGDIIVREPTGLKTRGQQTKGKYHCLNVRTCSLGCWAIFGFAKSHLIG